MSKIALTPNASGTGTLTIAAPNTNTDRTLTLPDVSETLIGNTSLRTELNASGSAPIYAARAWVNFNGTGTVAIRASGNVSSITDNGTGIYAVNFTTAMPDTNYAVSLSSEIGAGLGGFNGVSGVTTTSVGFVAYTQVGALRDVSLAYLAVFR